LPPLASCEHKSEAPKKRDADVSHDKYTTPMLQQEQTAGLPALKNNKGLAQWRWCGVSIQQHLQQQRKLAG